MLDDIDKQILDLLIENTRLPYTDIAKKLIISAGTVHVRVKKMEQLGLLKGSTLNLDYALLGYSFISYIHISLDSTTNYQKVIKTLKKIPHVTVAHMVTGKAIIMCKIRAKDSNHAKDILFQISDIENVVNTETSISLEEAFNDKKRLMHTIFKEMSN